MQFRDPVGGVGEAQFVEVRLVDAEFAECGELFVGCFELLFLIEVLRHVGILRFRASLELSR